MDNLTSQEIKEKLEKLESIEKKNSKQYKRQNDYIKNNYKRVSVVIKNEVYEELEAKILNDKKLNSYINELIEHDLKRLV